RRQEGIPGRRARAGRRAYPPAPPPVLLGECVDEVLRVSPVRVPLVCAEVRAVLEPRLRDDSARLQILVYLEAEVEVRLDPPGLREEPGERDPPVRVRVPEFNRAPFQEVGGLDQGELEPPAHDLPVEPAPVEYLRLLLVHDHRAVLQEVDRRDRP